MHPEQREWILDERIQFGYHALDRIRERVLTDVERTMDDPTLRRWTIHAWRNAAGLERFQDPDAPALPTYVAQTVFDPAWYLVGRPCTIGREGCGIVIISALPIAMYENNKRRRWRAW